MGTEFNVSELLAKSWGIEKDSPEFDQRLRDMRERAKDERYEIVPCGPACDSCGDNSYACGCGNPRQDLPST